MRFVYLVRFSFAFRFVQRFVYLEGSPFTLNGFIRALSFRTMQSKFISRQIKYVSNDYGVKRAPWQIASRFCLSDWKAGGHPIRFVALIGIMTTDHPGACARAPARAAPSVLGSAGAAGGPSSNWPDGRSLPSSPLLFSFLLSPPVPFPAVPSRPLLSPASSWGSSRASACALLSYLSFTYLMVIIYLIRYYMTV